MTNDETYNGYPNRETWAFMLHLNNDQGLYEMGREWATGDLYDEDDNPSGISDPELGRRVIERARELWAEIYDARLRPSEYDDAIVMWERETGSVWRVDERAVGESIRESLDDE